MAAPVLKMSDHPEKKKFTIPTIEEVKEYIKKKKGWTDESCKYYAEKFWHHYNARGWRLSANIPMKNWQSAFNSQWQTPKYKEDIDNIKKDKVEVKESPLNKVLGEYRNNFESVPVERLVKIYDYMKERKVLILTREEKAYVLQAYGSDPVKGKAACVKIVFDKMISYGKKF